MTGNVRRFVEKTGLPARSLPDSRPVSEPFILVTPTTGFGDIPTTVTEFLRRNGGFLRGVAVSGNANWGRNYGSAGSRIAAEYGIPLLLRFELAGTDEDVRKFNEGVTELSRKHTSN